MDVHRDTWAVSPKPHCTPQSVSGLRESPPSLDACFLTHSWLWGQWWFILGGSKGGHWARLLCLTWNWCFCVILWKVRFSRGESSTDITQNALIYIQQTARYDGKALCRTAMFWNRPSKYVERSARAVRGGQFRLCSAIPFIFQMGKWRPKVALQLCGRSDLILGLLTSCSDYRINIHAFTCPRGTLNK